MSWKVSLFTELPIVMTHLRVFLVARSWLQTQLVDFKHSCLLYSALQDTCLARNLFYKYLLVTISEQLFYLIQLYVAVSFYLKQWIFNAMFLRWLWKAKNLSFRQSSNFFRSANFSIGLIKMKTFKSQSFKLKFITFVLYNHQLHH